MLSVRGLREDLGDDPGNWIHSIFSLIRQTLRAHIIHFNEIAYVLRIRGFVEI